MLNRYVQSGLVPTVGMLILFLCGVSHAVPLVLQPLELNPGDKYRLVFVTSTSRNAISTDIADYNDFVQAAADASSLSALGQTWKAIGSTASVDARDNTNTNPFADGTGEPLYVVDGTKIAVDYQDLWDGSILSPLSTTELGSAAPRFVWTGTTSAGLMAPPHGLGLNNPLHGDSTETTLWIDRGTIGFITDLLPVYGMSGVITAVPEPTTVLLCLEGLLVIGFLARRKRIARRGQHPANHS